eukprot:9565985-Ditylum_brightwellii.AAC.1
MLGVSCGVEAGFVHPASDLRAVGDANIACVGRGLWRAMWRVMAAAKNSSVLRVKTPMRSGGSCHRQAVPVAVYPPMPCSDASDQKR